MVYTVPRLFHHFIDVFTTIWHDHDEEYTSEKDGNLYEINPVDPANALSLAVENLHLLADLLEAHYISHAHSRLQRRAMKQARQLADLYASQLGKPSLNYVLDVHFEILARDLMSLKQCNLITEAGNSWCDIMRMPVRTAALAIKSYQQDISKRELSLQSI